MRNKVGEIILLLCLLLVAVGCTPSPKEALGESGLFGEHALARIENFAAIQGAVHGSFFLGIGPVNGSLNSELKIQFYWSPKPNEIIATALPYSKFRFIIDETKDTPTIEFVFDDYWLNNNMGRNYSNPVKYPNLNIFVLSDIMELARVRISMATMEKEIYLPKIGQYNKD